MGCTCVSEGCQAAHSMRCCWGESALTECLRAVPSAAAAWVCALGGCFLGVAHGAGTRVRPSWVLPMEQAPGCVLLGCRPWSRHQGVSFLGVAYGAGTRVRPSWVSPMEQAPGCVLLGCRLWSRHQGASSEADVEGHPEQMAQGSAPFGPATCAATAAGTEPLESGIGWRLWHTHTDMWALP